MVRQWSVFLLFYFFVKSCEHNFQKWHNVDVDVLKQMEVPIPSKCWKCCGLLEPIGSLRTHHRHPAPICCDSTQIHAGGGWHRRFRKRKMRVCGLLSWPACTKSNTSTKSIPTQQLMIAVIADMLVQRRFRNLQQSTNPNPHRARSKRSHNSPDLVVWRRRNQMHGHKSRWSRHHQG